MSAAPVLSSQSLRKIVDPMAFLAGSKPDIVHAKTRRLYEYWLSRRGDRRFPSRADIDPLDFVYALGDVILVDVDRARDEFRYRLVGTNCVRRTGYDPTGKTTAAVPGAENRKVVEDHMRAVAGTGEPSVRVRETVTDNRLYAYEVMVLPLGADGRVDQLLIYLNYDFAEKRR